jgi:hypothetical protein
LVVDVDFYVDPVCWGKQRSWALEPASYKCPDCGISDNLLIINGVLHGTNCDLLGLLSEEFCSFDVLF